MAGETATSATPAAQKPAAPATSAAPPASASPNAANAAPAPNSEADQAATERQAKAAAARDKALRETPVVIEGDQKLGGPFSIRGEGFGTQGSLTIGGEFIKTTQWTDRSIKGSLPAGLEGDVVLKVAGGTRHGKWPHPRPVVTKTTTVTVETK